VTDGDRPVLLDTHYWIWQQSGQKDFIPLGILKSIDAAVASGSLLLSAISVWELAMLEAKGRVRIHLPCEEWVTEALATPGLTLVPLTPEIAIHSTRLPGNFHADPSDRIIAATARIMGARLATRDEKMIAYARQRHISVC